MSMDERKAQLSLGVDVNQVKEDLAKVQSSVVTAVQEIDRNVSGISERTTKNLDAAIRRATEARKRDLAQLSAGGGVTDIVPGGRGTADYFQALAAMPGADASRLAPAIERLRQYDAILLKAAGAARTLAEAERALALQQLRTHDGNVSAKQQVWANRLVPAQFTDIVTGLAGGQNPMMVLIQQGGQLKDMFGGVGAAARGLGAYVAGLINPMTLTTAAAAGLATAFVQGEKESAKLAQAIILTGNAAGTSLGALQRLAEGVSGATGASQGAASEVLAQAAATGRIAEGSLGKVAEAALRLERTGVQAAEETVKQFAELGKTPVEAARKLGEEHGFLTVELYRQIKALEEQGRTADAATLAQKAYLDALGQRLPQLEANLGTLQKGWKRLKDDAASAWDAMLGVGRAETPETRLASLQKTLGERRAAGDSGSWLRGQTADMAREIESLERQVEENRRKAKADGDAANATRAAKALSDLADKSLDKEAQKRREIAKATETYIQAITGAVGQQEKMLSIAKDYERVIAGLNRDDKPKTARVAADPLADIKAQATAQAAGLGVDTVKEVEKLAAAMDKGALSAAEYNRLLGVVLDTDRVLAEEQRKMDEAADHAQQSIAKRFDQMDEEVRRLEERAELYGLTAAQIAAVTQARLEEERVRVKAKPDNEEELALLERELAIRERETDALSKYERKQNEAKESAKEARSVAKDLGLTFSSAFEDAIVKGRKFSEVLQGIAEDILRIAVRRQITEPFVEALGSKDFSTAMGNLFKFNAQGGVYQSPSLSAYSGGVYDSPRMFAFASGAGIFAEAGPEAIMPLRRGSDGKLGVQASGGGGVEVNVYNQGGGGAANVTQRQDDTGKTIIDVVIDRAVGAVAGNIRSGGLVAGAMEGTYGLNRAAGAWR